MRTGSVWIDGRLYAAEQARVSVFDRGFLYGDSVFEALRTYGGEPFDLDRHLARLERSAARVLIRMPVTREILAREVRVALAEAGHEESHLRIVITRGSADSLGLDPALASQPLRLIMVLPLAAPPPEIYARGIAAATYRVQRVADGTLAAGAKVSNYLLAVLARGAAAEQGAEEALIVDAEGRVLEGATSNVFGVRGAALVTPPEEVGILAGITRARVLEISAALGVACELRAPLVEELFELDELFVSSSIRELVPVVRVDGRSIGSGSPGPLTRRLIDAYRALTRGQI